MGANGGRAACGSPAAIFTRRLRFSRRRLRRGDAGGTRREGDASRSRLTDDELTEPTEPTELTELTEPTEPTEPTEQIDAR